MAARDAVVLAAGLGTRMRPLTERVPKPALTFLNRPVLHWTLEALGKAGVRRTVVNLHHLPQEVADCARAGAGEMTLRFSSEPEILGTAGLFWPVRGLLKGDYFFVVNGDLWGDLPLEALASEMEGNPSCLAALAVRPLPPGATYTPLQVDAGGTLSEFGSGRHFFTGVYAARRELLRNLPGPGFRELVRDLLRPLLPSATVRAITHDGRWFDLGAPATYLDAQLALLDEVAAGAVPVPQGSRLEKRSGHLVLKHTSAYLSRDAAVEGPVLLAEGARAEAGTTLARAALLPKTILREGESLRDAVALDELRVKVR